MSFSEIQKKAIREFQMNVWRFSVLAVIATGGMIACLVRAFVEKRLGLQIALVIIGFAFLCLTIMCMDDATVWRRVLRRIHNGPEMGPSER